MEKKAIHNSSQFNDSAYVFGWDDISESDLAKLGEFLKEKFSLKWSEPIKVEKIDNGNTIKISNISDSIIVSLDSDKSKARLTINNKLLCSFAVKTENGKIMICDFPTYQSDWDYLSDELYLLDLILNLNFLNDVTKNSNLIPIVVDNVVERALKESAAFFEKEILTKRKKSIENGKKLSLPYLSELFGLDRFEEHCILACLATEINSKYSMLYKQVQNGISSLPTIDLLLKLNSSDGSYVSNKQYFLPSSSLLKNKILHINNDQKNDISSLFSVMRLDERITGFLFNVDHVGDIESIAQLIYPHENSGNLFLDESLKQKICDIAVSYVKNGTLEKKLVYNLAGENDFIKLKLAESVSYLLKVPLLKLDLAEVFARNLPFESTIQMVMREALLQQAIVYIHDFDKIHEDNRRITLAKIMSDWIQEYSPITFISGKLDFLESFLSKMHLLVSVNVDSKPKISFWENIARKYKIERNIDFALIADRFNFDAMKIEETFNSARNLSMLRIGWNYEITFEDLLESCKLVSSKKILSMAKKIEPRYSWDDIILPMDILGQLREISNHIKYRNFVLEKWGFGKWYPNKGLNILFSGRPGTGKTMAAEILAGELYLDLYKIDLSSVVSKYVGDTEKHLKELFTEAERGNKILFIDEFDSLGGKRTEITHTNDRWSNMEVNYLLQKIEMFQGVCVLATNFKKNIDEAFIRRLQFIVDFPSPNEDLRKKIWEKSFPQDAAIKDDIDFDYLAKQFDISGGNIKNIVYHAAIQAASKSESISMKHIVLATKGELAKSGISARSSDFGEYCDLLEDS